MPRIPIFKPDYRTLTKCEILVDYDPDSGSPTN